MTGYALKVFALYATSLQEVLLLDCDSMPIIDPQDAFNSLEFRHVPVANAAHVDMQLSMLVFAPACTACQHKLASCLVCAS